MMKICCGCKLEKPLDSFAKNKRKKDGYNGQCKSCHSEYRKRDYAENKVAHKERIRQRKLDIIDWYHEYKSTLSCERCPEKHIACLHFHHKNPDEKEKDICKMVLNAFSKESILAEMSKCMVICANCHAKLHWDERQSKKTQHWC